MVTECRHGLRQLDQCVTDVAALAAEVVGGGVDEGAERADPARLRRLQFVGEALKLGAYVIPLHGDRGAFLGYDGAVGHLRSALVGRCELDGTCRHQHGRQDHRLRVRRHLLTFDGQAHLHPLRFDVDPVDLAHADAENTDFVTDEESVGVVEVGREFHGVRRRGRRDRDEESCDQDHDRDHGDGHARMHRPTHWPPPGATGRPSGPTSPGAGTYTGVGVGSGVDS